MREENLRWLSAYRGTDFPRALTEVRWTTCTKSQTNRTRKWSREYLPPPPRRQATDCQVPPL